MDLKSWQGFKDLHAHVRCQRLKIQMKQVFFYCEGCSVQENCEATPVMFNSEEICHNFLKK